MFSSRFSSRCIQGFRKTKILYNTGKRFHNSGVFNNEVFNNEVFKQEIFKINGFEETIWKGGVQKYYKVNNAFEGIKQIGIIGWGSQAKSQAKNMRDTLEYFNSDIEIKIGLRENSSSTEDVLNSGFNTGNMYDVLSESDFNILLISDKAQVDNYDKIFQNLKPGSTLGFSHGFLLGHLNNHNKEFPKDINVVMMAPKGMGPSLRKLYKVGEGINSSIDVYQETENSVVNPLNLALGWGISVGSPYIFKTDMKSEYISDIFGERAILLGGLHGIVEFLFREYYKKKNFTIAYQKSCLNITNILNPLISTHGLIGVYENILNMDREKFIINFIKSYNISKILFEEIYDEVKSGNEIRSVEINGNKEMTKIDNTDLWEHDRDFKTFYNGLTNTYIEPKTAGIYLGAIMAQVDILRENGHSYSEIVNESIIEATDSLIPYMRENGIAYMIDNCSTTARLGARKWAPRLDYMYQQNINNCITTYIKNSSDIEEEFDKLFLSHPIHNAISELYKFK